MIQHELDQFGIPSKARPTHLTRSNDDDEVTGSLRCLWIAVYVVVNLPAWIMMDSDTFFDSLIISGIAIYLLFILGRKNND